LERRRKKTNKNMSNNPIDELRGMQVPVSEQEWEAIVHDKRYLKKFGKKARLSPKGRAALIASAAAVLITVPILISTLSHKTTDTVQDNRPVVQSVVLQQEAAKETTPNVSTVTTKPVTTPKSEETRQALPSTSGATVQATTHEQSTLTAVTEARVPSNNPSAVTNIQTSTATPTITLANNTPTETSTTTKHEPLTNRSDNQSQPANTNLEENQPMVEKSQDNSESESEALNEFFIPSAFSPNGDGVNDLFFVKANFVPQNFEMNILNRNGELVFRTREIDSQWDGKIRNQKLPEGVYVCIIKYTDQNGEIKTKKGQVLLLQ
jgi:gliding motility-associated-like protein